MIRPWRTILPDFTSKRSCKVATDGDLKLEFYRRHAVVGDVEIFMLTATDPSADGEAERARRNEANHIVACFRRFDRMFQGMGVIG